MRFLDTTEVTITTGQGTSDLFARTALVEEPALKPEWLDDTSWSQVLRAYQREQLSEVAQAVRSHRRVLIQAPTGAGKTHLIATMAGCAVRSGMRVLILATRTKLVRQIHERLEEFEIRHGVLAASLRGLSNWAMAVQVASVDTLYSRCMRSAKMPMPPADVVIFDEAHLALGATRTRILDSYPKAFIVGLTATPAKTSGKSLKDQFDTLVLGPSIAWLIEQKMLVPPLIFAKPIITKEELASVRKDSKTRDYVTEDVSKIMRRPKLVGGIVENWLRNANGLRTLVFTCDKGHGADVVQEFLKAGIACEQLTDADDDDTREIVIERLRTGVTKVVVNCFLLSYGIDIPEVECIVLARPTRSVPLYLQAVGRGARPFPGKTNYKLIDHGRVVQNLGRPTYERDWSLDEKSNVNDQAAKQESVRAESEERPIVCAECDCEWLRTESGSNCPNCGWKPAPKPKQVEIQHAELAELDPELDQSADMEKFFCQSLAWSINRWPQKWQEKPKSLRWQVWMTVIEKFKRPTDERMPSHFWNASPEPCTPEVAGWQKARIIRWARSKRHATV